jgi:DinB superfamily
MRFSNPSGSAVGAAGQYVSDLLALLGSRKPFAVLAETPGILRAAIAQVAVDVLRRPEAPGKWSVAEVLQHLADSELINGYRIRLMLAHDHPPIPGYDQDAWARRLHYEDVEPIAALTQFESLRAANLSLWRKLTEAELARTGLHSERGPESVGYLIKLIAAHDLVHFGQITRILVAVGG